LFSKPAPVSILSISVWIEVIDVSFVDTRVVSAVRSAWLAFSAISVWLFDMLVVFVLIKSYKIPSASPEVVGAGAGNWTGAT